ncbi:major outer sheath C-terminal domain-containing protein, partial [Treponema pallidum]
LCFQYAVELRASPIKPVEFSVRWEQGLLSQDPYMLIEENWSWPGYTGSLFLGCKITW